MKPGEPRCFCCNDDQVLVVAGAKAGAETVVRHSLRELGHHCWACDGQHTALTTVLLCKMPEMWPYALTISQKSASKPLNIRLHLRLLMNSQ